MFFRRLVQPCLVTAALALFPAAGHSGDDTGQSRSFPFPETLSYRIEWRMVNAGTANLTYKKENGSDWQIDLNITSAGLVDRLYRVSDKYTVSGNDRFCASSAFLDAQEGKKHTLTHLSFDHVHNRVDYSEHDAIKDTDKHATVATPACAHEVTGALALLGELALQPGQSTAIPVTDGKKLALARIEAQAKESIDLDGKKYNTIRYQAYVFDNILYKRKGRLFLWLTDDGERTPVQFRIELGFPIGNISLQLEKRQSL